MDAILLVGIQGSGKSTFYKQRFFDTHLRISLDMLRTRKREATLVATCFALGQPFAVDNTNPTRADRSRYVQEARAHGCPIVAYHFVASLAECRRRNAMRPAGRIVPPAALAATQRRLEVPSCAEGFAAVFEVRVGANGDFLVGPAETATSAD